MAVAYLDVEDEITNAVARIRASEDLHLALVLPPGSRIGTSRINFRLLAREAGASQRRIAIVTIEPGVRAIAVSAGLPAYASVAEYEASFGAAPDPVAGGVAFAAPPLEPSAVQATPAMPPGESAPLPPPAGLPVVRGLGPRRTVEGGRRRWWVGIAAVLAILLVVTGAAAVLLLPSADITVVPRVETVGPVPLSVVADPAVSVPDLAAGVVPAQVVELPLEASMTFQTSGVEVTETKATGSVTFINNDTSAPNSIAAGSIVATDSDVRFRTLATVTVPRAKFRPRYEPGRASVRVVALVAGTSGNVAANAIRNVPSDEDPSLLEVTNPEATSGGTHTETKKVSQEDVDKAVAALAAELDAQLATALDDPGTAPAGTSLFPATARRGDPVADPAAESLVGQAVESFDLTLTARATVTAVDESLLQPLARAALKDALPAGREIFPDSVHVTVGAGTVDGAKVRFEVSATEAAWQPLDAAALLAEVKGLSVAAAREALSRYGEVTVETWPGYVDTIPTFDGRATLTVLAPSPSLAP